MIKKRSAKLAKTTGKNIVKKSSTTKKTVGPKKTSTTKKAKTGLKKKASSKEEADGEEYWEESEETIEIDENGKETVIDTKKSSSTTIPKKLLFNAIGDTSIDLIIGDSG